MTIQTESKFQKEELKTLKAKVNRPKRIPLGSQTRFNFPQRPGYRRYLFNDTGTNLAEAELAGYTFVLNRDGNKECLTVDRSLGMKGYLMETPLEFYNEDQEAYNKKIDETEKSLGRTPAGKEIPTEYMGRFKDYSSV